MIRAALVGVSGYGRWHLLMAMEQMLLGRIELIGVTVINRPQQEAICRRLEKRGIPIFSTFEAMMAQLAGRVDLLLLPTAIQWHAPMALAGLHSGANVLVEKPMAATVGDIDAVISAQHRTKRLVAVGFQDLYDPGIHDVKRRILSGQIGRVRQIRVRGQWPRSSGYYGRNNWAGRLRVDNTWVLDSPINNAYAHFLMLALFWAGETPDGPGEIATIDAELYRVNPIESFDTVSLRLRTSGDSEILVHMTHAGQEESPPEVSVLGEKGSVTWRYEGTCVIEQQGRPAEILKVPEQLDVRLRVLDATLTRLETGEGFVVTPDIAREHTRLTNALHEFFPILSVSASHLDIQHVKEGETRRIRDLDLLIARASASGQLFSEAGAPWAKPSSGTRSLRGYQGLGRSE
ncbi:MAG: Gfo/Idh/MocA family oxidoreductase [Opitutaceae bacterium]|nr:Gfo/Idh/MocA family oxidoreductase [Opitutaceae bacterium]